MTRPRHGPWASQGNANTEQNKIILSRRRKKWLDTWGRRKRKAGGIPRAKAGHTGQKRRPRKESDEAMPEAKKPIGEREYLEDFRSFIRAENLPKEGVSGELVSRMIKSNEVEATWIGYSLYFRRKDVSEWLAKNAQGIPKLNPDLPRFPRRRRPGPTWQKPDAQMLARYATSHRPQPLPSKNPVLPPEGNKEPAEAVALGSTGAQDERTAPASAPKAANESVERPSSSDVREGKTSCPFGRDELLALRERLATADSKKARLRIYQEIGVYPQALGVWLKKAGIPRPGDLPKQDSNLEPEAKQKPRRRPAPKDELLERVQALFLKKSSRSRKRSPQPTRGPSQGRAASGKSRATKKKSQSRAAEK